ncbi:MAG: LysM peptidoglycan-binding domain-containing protein [Croceitalea sp.]|nr:LysM peptidoglycan-binding domain-containing protein [Croceitalea sp.]
MGIMKKKDLITISLFVLTLLMVNISWAQQKFTTHAVKEGETIYSIAKQYLVTPYSILQENPEIKNSNAIKPNTLLIIPLQGNAEVQEQDPKVEKDSTEITEVPIEPLRFKRHKVRRKETLFSLSQKYNITEEQIKKYNTELYASPLKKGMVLQMPEYPEIEEIEEVELEYDTHTVMPKETRWSIANKHKITVDSLLLLNPELPKNSSYLAAGQKLKLPKAKDDILKEQKVAIFESYTVPKAMGIFRISQNYGIPIDSVIKLNPEINEIGGLKEGMVLRLPKQKPKDEIVNTDNYIFYQVLPKQTIFRLTQNLKISRDSLLALNPELENGLKSGMVLKLPKQKTNELNVKNSLVLNNINLMDSINLENKPKLMLLLPFRLDRINFKDSERTKSQVETRNDIKYAMGIYTGAIVALDSIKKLGISVNMKVLDTERDLDKLKRDLSQESWSDLDAILGPVDPRLLNEAAVQAATHNVPVIAPFASQSELSLTNVFYSMPDDSVLRERMLEHIQSIRTTQNLIIIADENNQIAKDSILRKFPMARVAKMSQDKSLHLEDFLLMLSEKEENWVFLETEKPNLVASVSSILNAAIAELEDRGNIRVKMFTTNYNGAFEGEAVSRPHLSNLQFTFSSAYREFGSDSFTRAYQKRFGHEPDRYAVRGFDLTFDLLLKLAHKKNLFETSKIIGQTEYSGNRFNYFNDWTSGFYNRATYLMQYDQLRIKQIDVQ